ncbi:MAG: outer membrane lipoprotein chaperone LolA [Candidatus Binatia bacterium]
MKGLLAAVLLPTLLAAALAWAAAPNVDEVVRKLQDRYDQTTDFTADFAQSVDVETLGQKLEAKGRVAYKRPGRMRWEFVTPEEQIIVADGETLWIYQPSQKQVLRAPFKVAFQSAMPISFLFGIGRLTRDFTPTLASADADRLRVRLEPKSEADIGVLVLDVDPKTYDVRAAEVTDPFGNVTRLEFKNLKRGVGVPDSTFVFRVPDGVDVVEPPAQPQPAS